MEMTFKLDTREFDKMVASLTGRDAAIALSRALNDAGKDALKHVEDRMMVIFDRPTPFAKKAFTIRGAKPQNLEVTIFERPDAGSKHFLKVQERGGARPQTGVERLFNTRMAYDGNIRTVVPASAALLNQYGNWKTGERNRVLSAVQAQSDRMMNSTKVSKVKNRNAKQFFVPRPGSKLSPGVWKRTSKKAKLQKVLHFSDTVPMYQPRLGFLDGCRMCSWSGYRFT